MYELGKQRSAKEPGRRLPPKRGESAGINLTGRAWPKWRRLIGLSASAQARWPKLVGLSASADARDDGGDLFALDINSSDAAIPQLAALLGVKLSTMTLCRAMGIRIRTRKERVPNAEA